jgi:hypothetical protein
MTGTLFTAPSIEMFPQPLVSHSSLTRTAEDPYTKDLSEW